MVSLYAYKTCHYGADVIGKILHSIEDFEIWAASRSLNMYTYNLIVGDSVKDNVSYQLKIDSSKHKIDIIGDICDAWSETSKAYMIDKGNK